MAGFTFVQQEKATEEELVEAELEDYAQAVDTTTDHTQPCAIFGGDYRLHSCHYSVKTRCCGKEPFGWGLAEAHRAFWRRSS